MPLKKQKSKHFLFHALLKQFRQEGIKNVHLLVGVSGGMDSLTLLSVLGELKKVLNLKLSVVHIQHGAKTPKQKQFQNKAQKTTERFYTELQRTQNTQRTQTHTHSPSKKNPNTKNLKEKYYIFKVPLNKKKLKGEAEMREARYEFFAEALKKSKADYLSLAHTKEDLLETRLIRLIRGVGEQGLRAMSFKKDKLIRPFIDISRNKIKDYAKKRKLKWCEDPTNKDQNYSLRNWLRHKWLPMLETKRPGSTEALFRSLELMTHQAENKHRKTQSLYEKMLNSKKSALKRNPPGISLEDKKALLAHYLKENGFKNYRTAHITEMLKQMDRPQKEFSFPLLGVKWKISAKWISYQDL